MMRHPLNAIAALVALVASCTLAWIGQPELDSSSNVLSSKITPVEQVDFILDHDGQKIICHEYQRIICASSIAAGVLPELVSVERIIMVPAWHRKTSPSAFKTSLRDTEGHSRIKALESLASIEVLVAAKPDLILLNSLSGGGGERIQRLRSLNLNVLDLGPMLGAETFIENIRTLGQVLRVAARGEHLARSFRRRLERVNMVTPGGEAKGSLYIGNMGGSLIGGTKGSSYHDLLIYSGLKDLAADQGFTPWPSYTPEQVMAMNPEVIVTEYGKGASLRGIPGFHELKAFSDSGSLVELPPGAETIGFGLLDAVEALHETVHGWQGRTPGP